MCFEGLKVPDPAYLVELSGLNGRILEAERELRGFQAQRGIEHRAAEVLRIFHGDIAATLNQMDAAGQLVVYAALLGHVWFAGSGHAKARKAWVDRFTVGGEDALHVTYEFSGRREG